jgi:hypothetical protein
MSLSLAPPAHSRLACTKGANRHGGHPTLDPVPLILDDRRVTTEGVDTWIPYEFVRLAQQLTLERFQMSIEGRYCLALMTSQKPELVVGLLGQRNAPDVMPEAPALTRTDVAMLGTRGVYDQKGSDRDAQCLQKLRALRYEPCYLLPLLKYTESSSPTSFSIGRANGQDIYLRDKSISRLHATVDIEGARYVLRDCGSHNHTFVNEQKIERAELQPGDALRFGTVHALVCTPRAVWYAARATPMKPGRHPA